MALASESPTRLALWADRRSARALPWAALILDLALVAATLILAVWGRRHLPLFLDPADVAGSLTVAGPLMALAWVSMIALRSGYSRHVFGAGTDEYKRVIAASMLTAGAVGIGCYLTQFQLSRGFFVLAFGIGLPVLVLGRWVLRRAIHRARRQGAFVERVLIAGSPTHVDEVAAVFRRESWLGYRVRGALLPSGTDREETPSGIPVLGTTETIAATVRSVKPDVLFITGGALPSSHQMRRLAWDLEDHPVRLVVAPNVTDISSERVRVRPVGGLPLVHLARPQHKEALRWAKRLFDIVGSTALLLFFAPLLAVMAVRIKRHDGGPVLFRQTRIGRGGRPFECLKLRTMVQDAESLLDDLKEAQKDPHRLFKMKDDPRVTTPGAWLRRYSFDELPQLWNVLRGEMSLVGPRPPLVKEVAEYDDTMRRRLNVRPGMTGLWQVSGRSDLSWDEAIRLDLFYVDNWSMVQDMAILTKTLRAVVSSRGAY